MTQTMCRICGQHFNTIGECGCRRKFPTEMVVAPSYRLANTHDLLLSLSTPFSWVKVGGRWECNWGGWLLSVDNDGTEESGAYNDECRIYINDGTQVITRTYYEMRNSELRREAEDIAIATRVRQEIRKEQP